MDIYAAISLREGDERVAEVKEGMLLTVRNEV